MSKTQFFEKKANFPVKKRFWPIFSKTIECDRPQGTIYGGSRGILTIFMEVTGIILQHLRSCLKHKFLKKKANFPVKKKIWPIFSPIIECDKPPGIFCKYPQKKLTATLGGTRSFL